MVPLKCNTIIECYAKDTLWSLASNIIIVFSLINRNKEYNLQAKCQFMLLLKYCQIFVILFVLLKQETKNLLFSFIFIQLIKLCSFVIIICFLLHNLLLLVNFIFDRSFVN